MSEAATFVFIPTVVLLFIVLMSMDNRDQICLPDTDGVPSLFSLFSNMPASNRSLNLAEQKQPTQLCIRSVLNWLVVTIIYYFSPNSRHVSRLHFQYCTVVPMRM